MGQLQDRMIEDLTLRGSAPNTHLAYVRCARAFVAFHRRPPAELGEEHVRTWLLHLLTVRKRSPRTVNVHIAALRVLYDVTLQRPEVMVGVRAVRTKDRQPDIPSGQQVRALLDAAPSLKHRAMFMLLYGAGLRVSEMLALTTADIDSARMVLHIRDTKNRHDRIVPLPRPALDALRAYWKEERPSGPMLFEGRCGRETLTRGAVNQGVSRAARKAGIPHRVQPHLLRHARSQRGSIPAYRPVYIPSRMTPWRTSAFTSAAKSVKSSWRRHSPDAVTNTTCSRRPRRRTVRTS